MTPYTQPLPGETWRAYEQRAQSAGETPLPYAEFAVARHAAEWAEILMLQERLQILRENVNTMLHWLIEAEGDGR